MKDCATDLRRRGFIKWWLNNRGDAKPLLRDPASEGHVHRESAVCKTCRPEACNANRNETANEAVRGFTYHPAQPADSAKEWWCEAKDRRTDYSEVLNCID